MRYIFFKLYKYYSTGDIIPLVSTTVAFFAIIFLVELNLILIIDLILNRNILLGMPPFKLAPIGYFIFVFIHFGLIYLLFLKEKSLEYYSDLFKDESPFSKKYGGIAIALSVVLMIFLVFILLDMKK